MIAFAIYLVVATPTPADCALEDYRCKAERSERRAASPTLTPDQRASFLHSAHRSYLFLFDRTGQARDLCAARRTLDASLAVEGQSAEQRQRHEAGHTALASLEHTHAARCARAAKPRSRKGANPVVVASRTAPPSTEAVTDPPPPFLASTIPPSSDEKLRPSTPATDTPTPPTTTSPSTAPSGPVDALMPVPQRRAPPGGERRPGQRLVIAGGVVLVAGLALTGAAGYLGQRMVETRRKVYDLHDTVDGFATNDQDSTAGGLYRDYLAMGRQTLGWALAGGTTVVIAAVLAGVGGRRMARAASRTSFVPTPGGLAFHARF